jgi:hypothetical protein
VREKRGSGVVLGGSRGRVSVAGGPDRVVGVARTSTAADFRVRPVRVAARILRMRCGCIGRRPTPTEGPKPPSTTNRESATGLSIACKKISYNVDHIIYRVKFKI